MVVAGIVYLLATAGLATLFPATRWLVAVNLALSLFAIGQFGYDKLAARNGYRRVPESGLQITALLGGWPGSAVAQSLFHHKTQKGQFRRRFVTVSILNVLATASTLWYLLLAHR